MLDEAVMCVETLKVEVEVARDRLEDVGLASRLKQ